MCQDSNRKCNDISQLTANTGIAAVSTANPNLDGSGAIVTVLTAGEDGTTIKSVTIKSVPESEFSYSQQGMVRLFIQSSGETPVTTLYKEVPIPAIPSARCMPLPMPVYTSFETILTSDLKLQAGYSIVASTQCANTFNIIAEGLDWEYPESPTVCCNFEEEVAVTGVGIVSVPYDGTSGTIVNILTTDGDYNGTTVKSITIKALQSTHEGMVSLFISPDGVNYSLMRQVLIPQTEQSAYIPSFKQVIEMNFDLEAGYILAATTQNAEGFAITVEGIEWTYA